jgi:hypothetical protein
MFRFTIRDVLWLTVVVGLAVGWWIDRRNVETTLLREVNRVGGAWALEVGHPVTYTIVPGPGTRRHNIVMGP